MSDNFNYKAGIHNVGSYQVSGIPYATGSLTVPNKTGTPVELIFPSMTQRIHIHNNDQSGNKLRIGFSANGVRGSNFWLLEGHDTNGKTHDYTELRIKVDRIYLLGDETVNSTTGIYVAAELTGITGYGTENYRAVVANPNLGFTGALSGSAGIG